MTRMSIQKSELSVCGINLEGMCASPPRGGHCGKPTLLATILH